MQNAMLNVKEISKELGVSIPTVRSWIKNGKIRYRKVGRFIRFTREDINDFIITKEPKK
ncbi:MAG: helix-turn-helix domain-containing protein [Spirochaetes bacterium]|uniref:Helix-turn-helix domain-containing protein n=1 Tax=Candidatus Ornithospirochaeta stercoripullorum TaxID=2840899 RepID=A0A9D9H3Z0_9SPIO|nr:helix-turn-helix domain-containing protein [Candidatus Ornithospirochaeta stercoripullorum]